MGEDGGGAVAAPQCPSSQCACGRGVGAGVRWLRDGKGGGVEGRDGGECVQPGANTPYSPQVRGIITLIGPASPAHSTVFRTLVRRLSH